MKQPKIKALLRLDKPLSDNTYPIWIRITHLRKSSYIATGFSCQEEEWNPESCSLFESRPRITTKEKTELNPSELKALQKTYATVKVNPLAKKINSEIHKKVRKLMSVKDKLEANEQGISSKVLKREVSSDNNGNSEKSILQYWNKQVLILEGKESFGTARGYKSRLKVLKEDYLKGKDLAFDEVTVDFLQSYEAFLKARGIKKDTIHSHFKTIKAVYYRGIKERIITQDKNPFFVFKLELDKFKKKDRLNTDEIKRLQILKLEKGTRLFDARNLFLFSFYNAGIRIADLLQLKWSNIKDGRLDYVMGKTGKIKSVKLLPQAQEILKMYKSKVAKQEEFIFPFLKAEINRQNKAFFFNQINSKATLVNKCLKQLAEKAKIDKNLSNHIARHSFSDIARKKGTSIYDIQKLLGHSDIKVTKNYLESLDLDSQDKAHEAVFEGI